MSNADKPAYPIVETGTIHENVSTGLTKRELIAAMMAQGILAGEKEDNGRYRVNDGYLYSQGVAKDAVLAADALIEELEKKQTP